MDRFTLAVRQAIDQHNWLAALSLSLMIPDICARAVDPKRSVGDRYSAWFDEWVTPKYTAYLGPSWDQTRHIFMTGGDAYALRCALLHEGRDDVTEQRSKKALASFKFVFPTQSGRIHRTQLGSHLILDCGEFCLEICDSAEAWAASVSADEAIQERLRGLLSIDPAGLNILGIVPGPAS